MHRTAARSRCAAVSRQAKRCRPTSAGAGAPATAWTFLTGSARPRCCTFSFPTAPGEVKYGTTGRPVPGYDVRLVDDDGAVVTARGEIGELQVRGPTSALMYWNNREQSRATFLGEWTRSGDKYVEDDDGFLVYCGRRDDMLKVSGMYVVAVRSRGGAAKPSRGARSRRCRLARPRHADQAEGVRGAEIAPPAPVTRWRSRCRIFAARGSPRSNTRAGSNSATNCPKPQPAKSSASSCAPKRASRGTTAGKSPGRGERNFTSSRP